MQGAKKIGLVRMVEQVFEQMIRDPSKRRVSDNRPLATYRGFQLTTLSA